MSQLTKSGNVSNFDYAFQLRRIITLVSITVALAIIVVFPLGFYFTGFSYEKKQAQQQADHAADRLSTFIFSYPVMWEYQEERLIDALEATLPRNALYQVRFLDTDHAPYIEAVGLQVSSPALLVTSIVSDGIQTVGQVEVSLSARPLIARSAIFAACAVILALASFLAIRLVPFRALMRAYERLESAKKSLQAEVALKEQALSQVREHAKEMRRMALHDPLTGLPNRTLFLDRLEHAMHTAQREQQTVVVMMMDLDGFKRVNDSLGHHAGDWLIKQVGSRLSIVLRDCDTVARLGGDEFAIIATVSLDRAQEIAQRAISALKRTYTFEGARLYIGASIGLSVFPDSSDNANDLIRQADIAMYEAKRSGQDIALHDAAREHESSFRFRLMNELPDAIKRGDITLYYQPKIDIATGSTYGVEALVRWPRATDAFVTPETFVHLAEQSGHIKELTATVLDRALRESSSWLGAGTPLSLSVNLSALNLLDQALPETVAAALTKWQFPSSLLVLEITESAMMIDPARATNMLSELRDIGVQLSIDDFGTGYSSFVYLQKLPVDEIKIDKSFVKEMSQREDDAIIVRTIIDMSRHLSLRVVAEGVENRDVLNSLKKLGCRYSQGYHFSQPLSERQFSHWLTHSRWPYQSADTVSSLH